MEISILELSNLGYKNIIDIRDNNSYQKGRIPNATLINRKLLISKPEMFLEPNQTYYIYCERGIISRRVCRQLIEKGYKTMSIIGGYEAYLKFKNS